MSENRNCECDDSDKLYGVGCDVVSCKYHGCDNYCHANGINVESHNAIRKVETFCGTFEPKASM